MLRRVLHALPLIALATATSAFAQTEAPAPAPAPANNDIIVTARSLAQTAADLAACLARHCPPDEDVAATLAHAENQFVEGDYRDARGTMLASLRRNREHREQYPIEVSDLMRANGRVAAHLGEARAYQLSVLDMRDTLRAALPENDARVLAAQIEVADSRVRLGYVDEARRSYADLATRASALGVPRVAAFARIRQAMIDIPREQSQRVGARVREATAHLEAMVGQDTVIGTDLALLAEITLARIEREVGNNARTDALVARFTAGQGSRRPLLISSDPIRLPTAESAAARAGEGGSALARMQMMSVDNRWIDVGFWINGNGRVTDFEVLRSSGDNDWSRYVAASVNSRVYTPIHSTDGLPSQGFYIVERYTLTADFTDDCTGSHLRCRSSALRIERMDLTPIESANTQPS
ncbi:MAG: hypothetical protein ABL909_10770 [Sphingopyxis sp.]